VETPEIKGIYPIVYTPFASGGEIDEEDLGHLVDHLIASGVHGLAAVGFASECYKLTVPERRWLAEATFRACRGRVPVIVGTSGTNTAETVELSQHAEEIGARAVFVAPPLFGGAALDVLIPYFCAVSAAVSIPVIVQDGHIPIAPAQVARLAELYPNVSYVKERRR